jgi:hypothetical protein
VYTPERVLNRKQRQLVNEFPARGGVARDFHRGEVSSYGTQTPGHGKLEHVLSNHWEIDFFENRGAKTEK